MSTTPEDHSSVYDNDPLLWFERSRRSSRAAITYVLTVPIVMVLAGVIIATVSRHLGGSLCDAGEATWLCTRTSQILFSLVPFGIGLTATAAAFWITYTQWANSRAWRPWLGILWALIPMTLAWGTGTGSLVILGHT